jgi:hypothetical protein
MDHLDKQRMLAALGRQIHRREELSDSQLDYLQVVLSRIGNGDDANEVLGVRSTRGRSKKDAISRRKLSFILHWIACATYEDEDEPARYTVEKACEVAMTEVVPVANRVWGNPDNFEYDAAYLRKKWYAEREMQNRDRSFLDHAFPYEKPRPIDR